MPNNPNPMVYPTATDIATIRNFLDSGLSVRQGYKSVGRAKKVVLRWIHENKELEDLLNSKKVTRWNFIPDLSREWKAGKSVVELLTLFPEITSRANLVSYISKDRRLNGLTNFPRRKENQTSMLLKYYQYLNYKEQGLTNRQIAPLLEYRNVEVLGVALVKMRKLAKLEASK